MNTSFANLNGENDAIENAQTVIKETNELAGSKFAGSKIKDELLKQKEYFQNILNGILANKGLLTKDQLDALDEQTRLQKMNLINAKSNLARNKLIAVGILSAVILGGLFLYTSKKVNS